MVDPVTTARLGYRALYFALSFVIVFAGLLPLSTTPVSWPGPDLLLALTLAWVLRRPEYVPAIGIVAVFLIHDLLTMQPPGLATVIVLLGSEFLRSRVTLTRNLPFTVEWAMVAVVMAAMMIAERLVLALFMVPQVSFAPVVVQLVATIAAYPVIVYGSHLLFGLRKAAPGEVDALGHRI